MRAIALCLLLVFAAPAKKQWSKAHGIGVTIPNSWKILERDTGRRAFVVQGPKLGAGNPRLVVWQGGPIGTRSLKELALEFDKQVSKRAGWSRTAMADHEVGGWKAIRLGYRFQEAGKAKGRARISVILYGGEVYIIEMSAAARGFPAATFDAVERSIEGKQAEFTLVEGARAKVPPGWKAEKKGTGLMAMGPDGAMVALIREGSRDDAENTPPPQFKPAGKMRVLGARRPVFGGTHTVNGTLKRGAWIRHDGWTAIIVIKDAAWDEMLPGAAAIVASLKLKKG